MFSLRLDPSSLPNPDRFVCTTSSFLCLLNFVHPVLPVYLGRDASGRWLFLRVYLPGNILLSILYLLLMYICVSLYVYTCCVYDIILGVTSSKR